MYADNRRHAGFIGRRLTRFLCTISCAGLLCLAGLSAVKADTASGSSTIISFGIVPQQSAAKLARLWTPILEDLSATTGYRIEFKTAPNIPEFERRLAKGQYDMAYMNPYHYTTFNQHPGYQAFARAKDKRLKGIVVVRAASHYQELDELANQTLAFPSPAAFAASVVTRATLQSRAIPFEPKYVASHDSVYRSVAMGLYPAGGGVMRTFDNTEDDIRSQLRILWVSPGYTPHAFASHPRTDSSVVERIQSAMIGLEDSETGRTLLESLKLKGIEAASDRDWDDIRAMNLHLLDKLITPAP
jgi:phosphonate transport system substrate-binding protein